MADPLHITEAYKAEVVRLLLEEVNQIAKDMNLPEQLPITKSHLVDGHISPPALGMLGSISTSNYTYSVSMYKRFSALIIMDLGNTMEETKTKFKWPINRLDTNAAYAAALQIMTAAGMDAKALNRDCNIDILAAKEDEA